MIGERVRSMNMAVALWLLSGSSGGRFGQDAIGVWSMQAKAQERG